MCKMSQNINDISLIFQVLIHPDMISTNDSQLREKSDNIADISVRRRYCRLEISMWNDVRVTTEVCIVSAIYRKISEIYRKISENIEDI